MARPREFKVAAVAELFRQIRYASDEARLRQMNAAEQLAREVDPARNYPESFIVYRVTSYRPEIEAETLVVGSALLGDLCTFVQRLSETLQLPADHDGRHAITLEQAAQQLGVTQRTMQRYRRQGLVCHQVVDAAGRRLMCFEDSLLHFAKRSAAELNGQPSTTRISDADEAAIINEARRLREHDDATLHAAAKQLAARHGRAVETIRRLLKRHDEASSSPIFHERGPITEREQRIIERAYRRGIEPAELAQRFDRSAKTIHRALLQQRLRMLRDLPIEWITLPTFELADAGDVLLSPDVVRTHLREPPGSTDAIEIINRAKVADRPDADEEAALLGAYNFLKKRAAEWLAAIDGLPRVDAIDSIETDLRWAALLKRALVSRTLPVGVTTIERNLGRPLLSQSADEICTLLPLSVDVISETIERIDAGRGQRLERVCSFAIDRRLARQRFTVQSRRASARHGSAELPVDDPLRELCPWQARLDLSPALAGRVHRLASRDAEVVIRVYGLDGTPPQTLAQIAATQQTTAAGVSRRLRRAVLELRALAARDCRNS